MSRAGKGQLECTQEAALIGQELAARARGLPDDEVSHLLSMCTFPKNVGLHEVSLHIRF